MTLSRRDTLSGLLGLMKRAKPAHPDSRTVNVAFNYAAHSTTLDLRYLATFDILVTGGILSPDQIGFLQPHKLDLVAYVWSSAFYPEEGTRAQRSWAKLARKNAANWLLSDQSVGGGAAAPGKVAYWYDFGDASLAPALADHVTALIAAHGYKGVFLDTLGSQALPAPLLEEFRRRHPDQIYNEEQARFLSLVRERFGPARIIFTNQAYREPKHFLKHADFDLIENSFTYIDSAGATKFRPWRDAAKEWESIEVPMSNLIIPAARSFPKTRFVHLNVAVGAPATLQRAVDYCYASARLWSHSSFVGTPGIQKPIRGKVYFSRLGSPLTESYEEDADRGIAWRVFENGVVAVNTSNRRHRIDALGLDLNDPPRGYVLYKSAS